MSPTPPDYFVTDAASPTTAVRAFEREWVCHLPLDGISTGKIHAFDDKTRINAVTKSFGEIAGWRILELGSFEGADTYNFEAKGAHVIGIEANRNSYVRSLIAKEALNMRAHFWLGDFHKFLANADGQQWDMIFCAGVLYHMSDPIDLLWQISRHTGRIFIWSMYVSDANVALWPSEWIKDYEGHGIKCRYYLYRYSERYDRSYSGIEPMASRITKDTMIGALKTFGFSMIDIHQDTEQSRIMIAASKF